MYGSEPVGFNFLRVANVSIIGNESTINYTCVATNLKGTETVTVSVSAVGEQDVTWCFVVYIVHTRSLT